MKVLVSGFLAFLLLLCGASFASLLLFPSPMLWASPPLIFATYLLADSFVKVLSK